MRYIGKLLTIVLSTLILSCTSTGKTSVLYSDQYDPQIDITNVMIFPYGEIKIPGKWIKTSRNEISGQIFFIGVDSTKVAIALQKWDNYEFSYKNPEITPENFVQKFYEWDANYLKTKTNGQIKILTENKEKNYLVWSLERDNQSIEYFLFGLKEKTAYNLNISNDDWDEAKKIDFLQKLFIIE
jgi:hypothetical protein